MAKSTDPVKYQIKLTKETVTMDSDSGHGFDKARANELAEQYKLTYDKVEVVPLKKDENKK